MATTEEARHRRLFEKITQRGPNAFEIFRNILLEHFPDAHEILTHVSYRNRNMDTNDNEPSIRELLNSQFRNGIENQATNHVNNNYNYDIQNYAIASTSRPLAPMIRTLTTQFEEIATVATLRNRPSPRKTHIVEFKEQITPDLNVQVNVATQFHGEGVSKVGVCKLHPTYTKNQLIYIYICK